GNCGQRSTPARWYAAMLLRRTGNPPIRAWPAPLSSSRRREWNCSRRCNRRQTRPPCGGSWCARGNNRRNGRDGRAMPADHPGTTMQTTRLLPLLLCLCVGSALADTPIDLRHAASAHTHLDISNVKGAVSVIGWDRPELQVTGQLGEGAQPLAITGSAQALSLRV